MGRKDWYYVHLPKLLIKRLDQFLQTPRAKSMSMSSKPELLRHAINQFLDEQEALYNKMDYAGDFSYWGINVTVQIASRYCCPPSQ
jgi:metal-responsive CopG/Arc/MetJ family transcriptional regulator